MTPNNAITRAKLIPRIIKENTYVSAKKKKRDPSAKNREPPLEPEEQKSVVGAAVPHLGIMQRSGPTHTMSGRNIERKRRESNVINSDLDELL